MSAVGPRPLTADDVARLGWSGAEFDFRWACRPGLTGRAQLLGARPDDDALAAGLSPRRRMEPGARLSTDRVVVRGKCLRQDTHPAVAAAPLHASDD